MISRQPLPWLSPHNLVISRRLLDSSEIVSSGIGVALCFDEEMKQRPGSPEWVVFAGLVLFAIGLGVSSGRSVVAVPLVVILLGLTTLGGGSGSGPRSFL